MARTAHGLVRDLGTTNTSAPCPPRLASHLAVLGGLNDPVFAIGARFTQEEFARHNAIKRFCNPLPVGSAIFLACGVHGDSGEALGDRNKTCENQPRQLISRGIANDTSDFTR